MWSSRHPTRAMVLQGLIGAALAAPARAQTSEDAPPPPLEPGPDLEIVVETQTGVDEMGRVTAPVFINGAGPYRFFVDTGANRSAVSPRLAQRLNLPIVGRSRVHGLGGVVEAPMARLERLESGAVDVAGIDVPVLEGDVVAGMAGVLGVEAMARRRLTIDFERRRMQIARASRRPPGREWTGVPARVRLGQLVVTRAAIDGVRVNVIIDTGASHSFGNTMFTRALAQVRQTTVERHQVVGAAFGPNIFITEALVVQRMRLGDISATAFPALIADLHVFDVWRLREEPTLLLGMDVLSTCGALAIDYGASQIYFRPR
ncbi:MAG: retroviral-like aspartic protease family protein [Hyphomonadaceae bacterium]|nr:retroviral-like aspartic protease family protein [Hyphomonadaceae bacterium]